MPSKVFKIFAEAPYRDFFYQLIADNLNWVLSTLGASICITLRYQKIRTRRAKLNLKRKIFEFKNENKVIVIKIVWDWHKIYKQTNGTE